MPFARPLAGFAVVVSMLSAHAGVLDGMRDPQDDRFDLSDWLLDQKGVLPVPLVITEPAIGYGGGVMGLFFRESMRERSEKARESGRLTPPDIFGLGGIATENGTRGAVAGGMVSSEDGRYRWRGAVVRMDVNLDFFGIGGSDRSVGYNLNGWASVQQAMVRPRVGRAHELCRRHRHGHERRGLPLPAGAPARAVRGRGLGLEHPGPRLVPPGRLGLALSAQAAAGASSGTGTADAITPPPRQTSPS
jgi:hypothetical protein